MLSYVDLNQVKILRTTKENLVFGHWVTFSQYGLRSVITGEFYGRGEVAEVNTTCQQHTLTWTRWCLEKFKRNLGCISKRNRLSVSKVVFPYDWIRSKHFEVKIVCSFETGLISLEVEEKWRTTIPTLKTINKLCTQYLGSLNHINGLKKVQWTPVTGVASSRSLTDSSFTHIYFWIEFASF